MCDKNSCWWDVQSASASSHSRYHGDGSPVNAALVVGTLRNLRGLSLHDCVFLMTLSPRLGAEKLLCGQRLGRAA